MDNARALAIRSAFVGRPQGYTVVRGAQRLVFDQLPILVRNAAGDVVGVEVRVRLFQGSTEVKIDPHRIIINPPTVPRANLTFAPDVGVHGNPFQRRIVGTQNPALALIEALWDSIEAKPR